MSDSEVETWHGLKTRDTGAQPVEGYVFYHLQCTERAVKTGQLLLGYGSVGADEEALRRVADKVVTELRRAGLTASWGGTEWDPIVVDGVVWRRRRT